MDGYTKRLISRSILQVLILIFGTCYLLIGCVRLPSNANVSTMEYNLVDNADECKEGYINYSIQNNANSAAAPVITIYHGYKYGEISDMKTILSHIISSQEGIAAGLKEEDIPYYVSEWYCINMAHLCPLNASQLLGMDKESVLRNAEHADLNTDDEHAELYRDIFRFLRKKV